MSPASEAIATLRIDLLPSAFALAGRMLAV
jgi:hypothetical protein